MGLIQEIDFGTPESKSEQRVTLTIDGQDISVPAGTSIMRAAQALGTPNGLGHRLNSIVILMETSRCVWLIHTTLLMPSNVTITPTDSAHNLISDIIAVYV